MGLFRTAFIIAFVVVGTLSPFSPQARTAVWVLLIVATVFTVGLFLTFGAGRALPYQRPVALILDLLLVSAAVLMMGPGEDQAFFQVYYLIVVIGAIWFELAGALCTAAGAIVLFALVQYMGTYPTPLGQVVFSVLWLRGSSFLVLIALFSGYLVRALARQTQATAQFVQELQLARTVQDTILRATLPAIPGWELALFFEPARWVGGDLYEIAELPDHGYLILLGDMPGKSAYGLVHLSMIYSHVRGAALAGLPPAALATHVNRAVYDVLQPYGYAPLFIGKLQPQAGIIKFVCCGHLPPLLLRADGSEEPLATGSIVIGGRPDEAYQERQEEIHPGDLLVCYTDGITGLRNRAREEFGEQRLIAVARAAQYDGCSLDGICAAVARALREFSAEPRPDDATLVLLRRRD